LAAGASPGTGLPFHASAAAVSPTTNTFGSPGTARSGPTFTRPAPSASAPSPCAAGEATCRLLPNARLQIFERAAHAPFFSHLGEFISHLRAFLDD
jgi:pimeloyl-ACP methyl ester carboxylesterase